MDRLNENDDLAPGQSIVSADGRFTLALQLDGNLVLSRTGAEARWSTSTAGTGAARLTMQSDGNLVLYTPDSRPVWSTGTWGHPGSWAILQPDGNLVVYAAGAPTALWASDTWVQSKSVDGFLPSNSGLPFRNDYPPGTPWQVVNLPVVGQMLTADAGNGLCGGFGFTVVDMFLASPRLAPPLDPTRPPDGSPRFQYLTNRLLDSFNGAVPYGTILKLIDWISTPNGDSFLRQGLGHTMAAAEWPNIRSDIEANRPSPIVLVGPPQAGPADVATIKAALARSHQVVAYAYEAGPADVTIYVYDPNNPTENRASLYLSVDHPEQGLVTNNLGDFRGFFRSHYTWHDPRPVWG
jgi:hypothetical protein